MNRRDSWLARLQGTGRFRRPRFEVLESRRLLSSPTPGRPDLLAAFDSGVSDTDNLTNLDNCEPGKTLQFAVGGTIAGATVTLYADGAAIGSAVAVGTTIVVVTAGTHDLADGSHAIIARQTVPGEPESPDSAALTVTVDTTTPLLSNPALLGGYDTSGDACGVAVSGTLAYVADYLGGLQIIDVGNPASPVRLGGYDTSGYANGVVLSGTLAYVADGYSGVQIIDVSNPANPVRLGGYDTSGNAIGVVVCGTLAYVADSDSGLQIIDVGNPANPVRLGGYDTSGNAIGVVVCGTRAYVADNYSGLQIIDVGNPASPVRLGRYDTSGTARGVVVSGTLAYVADNDSGLQIIDVSNPANPARLGGYDTSGYANGVVLSGTLAYVADGYSGVQIIDVSNPTNPARLGGYDTSGYANGVVLSGTLAYVADYSAGLKIIDVSTSGFVPPAPDLESTSDTGISDTDNITADNTPTFTVSVPAGSYFRFYRDGVQISGDYQSTTSFAAAVQDNGTYSCMISAVDAAGNVSASSSPLSVTIDTSIPSAPDFLAASDSGVSTTDNLTKWDNAEFDKTLQFAVAGTIAGATVTLYADGTAIGSEVAAGATTTLTTSGSYDLTDGAHVITARQTVPGQPESPESAALGVTVDTAAPTAPSSAPDLQAASDTGISNTDNVTADHTPTFDVPASPYFRFYRDGVKISGDYQSGTSYTTPVQADGTCGCTISAIDAAGNESASSTALSVTIDTTAPAAPSAPDLQSTSDTGISNTDNITADHTPTLAVSVTTPYFRVYRSGTLISADYESGVTYTAPGQPDGTWSYTLKAADAAGNQSPASASLTVTIDTTAPFFSTVRLGGYDTSGSALGVAVCGTLAYVADHLYGLQIIDVGNPGNPARLGRYFTSGVVCDVSVIGTLAYVADAYVGLQIINVSNPANPVCLGGYDTPGSASGVAVSGTLAYVADGSAGLQIIDVSNPASPVRLAGYDTPGSASDVAVSGTLAYVADGSAGLQIVDVSNPASPVRLAGYDTSGDARGVAVSGTLAYVADHSAGLQIIDVSDPAGPVGLGGYDTSGYAIGVVVCGTRAYVADGGAGLEIFDVRNPASPGRLGGYDTSGSAGAVAVFGTRAYVADGDAGLQIIDVAQSAPSAPDLQPASDTGISNTDNITADNTPTFGVSASPYFRFYRDGVQISGDYQTGTSYTTAVQDDGTYSYTILVANAAGNVSTPSPALSVTIDSSIPSAPDLVAGSDSGVYTTDNLTNWDNSEPGKTLEFAVSNTIAGATVTLYADGSAVASAVAAGTTTTLTTAGTYDLADGPHMFTARQTVPGQPELLESAALCVTIDTTAPTAPPPPDLQQGSDTGIKNADDITADNTPTFDVLGSPYFRFYRDGVQISDDYQSGVSFTAAVQTDGVHDYTVSSLDAAGNQSLESVFEIVWIDTLSPDTPQAPDLQATSDTGISQTDNLTADDTPTFDVLGAPYFRFYRDGVQVSGDYQSGVSYLTAGQGEGTYACTISALDAAGNESPRSPSLSVTIDATAPLLRTVRRGGCDTSGSAYDVVLSGTLAYLAGVDAGVEILDVTNPGSPVWLGGCRTGGHAYGVAASGTLVYVADGSAGLQIIDVSNPAGPLWLGGYDTSGTAYGVAVFGTRAYVADGGSGLQIIDVGNPTSPLWLGGCDTSGTAYGVAVSGTLAYVADGYSGLQIIDVGNPASPLWVGGCDTSGTAYGVAVSGTLAYVADGYSGLQIIDVGNPAKPAIVGEYDTNGCAYDVAGSGTLVYVADEYSGLQIIDVSNPAKPAIVGEHDTNGCTKGVVVSGRLAYVADGNSGLQIIEWPPTPDLQPASDTGVSETDDLTADHTPTFDVPAGAPYFRVYRNGTPISGYESGASYTAPVQPDGTYDYTVTATDEAGNESPQSVALRLIIDTVAPYADIVDVFPDPWNTAVDFLTIQFNEPVFGFSVGDLSLNCDSGLNLITGDQPLSTSDNRTWTLDSLGALTGVDGMYRLTLIPGGWDITDSAGNSLAIDASETWKMDSRLSIVQRGADNDTFCILLDAGGPTKADVFVNADPPYFVTLADTSQFLVIGGAGDDELTVDFSNGNPLPAGGLAFDGGSNTAGDSLVVVGTADDDSVTVTPTEVTLTSPAIEGPAVMSYGDTEAFGFRLGDGQNSLTVDGAAVRIDTADCLSPGTSLTITSGSVVLAAGLGQAIELGGLSISLPSPVGGESAAGELSLSSFIEAETVPFPTAAAGIEGGAVKSQDGLSRSEGSMLSNVLITLRVMPEPGQPDIARDLSRSERSTFDLTQTRDLSRSERSTRRAHDAALQSSDGWRSLLDYVPVKIRPAARRGALHATVDHVLAGLWR